MKKKDKTEVFYPRLKRTVTVVCQLLLGSTFLFSGIVKAIDPVGTSIKITEYLQYFGWTELCGFSMGFAWALALMELGLGVYVTMGNHRYATIVCASLFMAVMTPLTLYSAIANPVEHCGCFGDVWVISNWQSFWKNVFLSACCVWIYRHRPMQASFMSPLLHTVYVYFVLTVALLLLFWGTWRLPFIDFRPYRPGVSLRSDDAARASADVDYVVVYQKEGKQREFSLDALPAEDSGWEFVETRVSGGTENPVGHHDASELVLFDEEGEEVTQLVLADSGYVMLLLSPDLSEAQEYVVDRIEGLYEYALQHNYPFYCVTQRDSAAITQWHYLTGSEYPYLYADKQVIETMIRSNPGFMLLHDGVIQWKSHLSGIDVPQLSAAPLGQSHYGEVLTVNRLSRVLLITLILLLPSLLHIVASMLPRRLQRVFRVLARRKALQKK